MPTQTFASPEAHAEAIHNANMRMTLLEKARVPWMMSSLLLHNLKAQWGQAGGSNVVEGTVIPRGVSIFVPTENIGVIHLDGRPFDAQTFRLQLPGDEFCITSADWHGWFTMFIPNEVLADWSANGTEAMTTSSRFIRVPQERAESFRRVIAQLGLIVQQAPGAFESSAAVDTTARRLTESVRETFWGQHTATTQPRILSIPRRLIVQVVMDLIDRRNSEYLTVPDLASAARVSEPTLRAAFQKYFGMGPVRYLKVRTLNLIRKALQSGDPSVTTVTGVATQFGVWELGRFAHDYQLLFGELPSETLRDVR